MKVIVNKGVAVSTYPDYMTEELILDKVTSPDAKMYRVKEGVNVMGSFDATEIASSLAMIEEAIEVRRQIKAGVIDVDDPNGITSTSTIKQPMTEVEIQAIAI